MTLPAPPPPGRPERILAYLVLALVALSIVAFLVTMVATGMGERTFGGAWALLIYVPLWGLPLAMLALIALLVVGARRRTQTARQQPASRKADRA